MTVRCFADTNIPLYALDTDPAKRTKALALMRDNPVVSVQVVNEFISVATGKMRMEKSAAHRLARVMLRRCEVVAMDAVMISEAIALGGSYGFSHWDSLIVAAALRAGCDSLYSEDMQHGLVVEKRLTIVNPFV